MIDNELILVGGISGNDLTGCTVDLLAQLRLVMWMEVSVILAKGNADPADDSLVGVLQLPVV